MKDLDLNVPILTLEGGSVMEGDRPLTVRDVIVTAVNAGCKGEPFARFRLLRRLFKDGPVALSSRDIEYIKEGMQNMGFTALVQGRVIELIDPATLEGD